jgi:hypothetical protein
MGTRRPLPFRRRRPVELRLVSGEREDRPPTPASAGSSCAECGAALALDQCYCLDCGARRGPRSAGLERILVGLREGGSPGVPSRPPTAASPARGVAPARPRAVLPGRLTAAVLTLSMLGFGTLAGTAASNPAGALAALRRGPLTLLMPTPTPRSTSVASASPPPVVEATPAPAAPVAEPASPAEAPAGSVGGSGGGRSSGGGSGGSGAKGSGSGAAGGSGLPPIKHVFLVMLADEPYAQTFGPESPAPYLSHTLEHRGELLVRYYAVAHEELADEIALISGLGPTPQTAANCPTYTDIVPTIANKQGQYGEGDGCIYPRAAQTIGDQLAAKHLTWRVYAQGMGDGGPPACRHPGFGASDPTYSAPSGSEFATFRDPFSYFDGVIHSPDCAQDDVGMEGLAADLKSAARTPTLSYIVPDLCDDGRPTPCSPGAQSGLPAADAFLRRVVPEILAAPAYRKGGLLIVTTDQAPTTGEYADSSSCCVQPRFPAPAVAQPLGASGTAGAETGVGTTRSPATAAPTASAPAATGPAAAPATTAPATTGPASTAPTTTAPATTAPASTAPATAAPVASAPPTAGQTTTPAVSAPTATRPAVQLPPSGGGQVGALLLSPYVKPGTFDQEPFNDFSLLRTLENLFGLPHLGYAALPKVEALGASVFNGTGG